MSPSLHSWIKPLANSFPVQPRPPWTISPFSSPHPKAHYLQFSPCSQVLVFSLQPPPLGLPGPFENPPSPSGFASARPKRRLWPMIPLVIASNEAKRDDGLQIDDMGRNYFVCSSPSPTVVPSAAALELSWRSPDMCQTIASHTKDLTSRGYVLRITAWLPRLVDSSSSGRARRLEG